MKKLFTLTMLLLCAVVGAWAETETLSGADATSSKDTEIAKTSFTMLSTYNPSGSRAVNSKSTLKVRFNQQNSSTGNTKGFALKVNEGYTITGLTMQVSGNGKAGNLDKIVIDGTEYSGSYTTELKKNDEYSTITLSGIAATDYINFVAILSDELATQLYVYITVTYEAPVSSEPQSTSVSPTSAYVPVGGTKTLTGSFVGGDFTGEWVSNNTAVATVSSEGVVTGVSEGTANITYQWTNNQSKDAYKATAAITVVEAFNKDGLAIVKNYDFANWGATTLTIESTKAGAIYNAANKKNNDVFRCTNEGLTSIAIQAVLSSSKGWTINDNGLYEGSGAGRCAAVCDVKAGQYIEFYHNSGTSFYTRNSGEEEDDGAEKIPLVEESNHHVYKVLEDGMVGFELTKGKYVTAITIYEEKSGTPTSLEFSATTAEATLGEAFTEPSLTKNPTDLDGVVFSSSNTAVATVDAATGEVTLVAGGVTTITATFTETEAYWGSTASYELTVNDPSSTAYTNETTTITWAFNTGASGQTASIEYGSATEDLFKSNSVSIGANLAYAGTQSLNGDNTGLTSTKIKQNDAGSATELKNAIKFTITPKMGMTFTPTSVRFLATRCGTDGGKMEIAWIDSEHAAVSLGSTAASKTSDDPARDNNSTNNATLYSYDLTSKGAQATTGECGLRIITYSAKDKSYAFGQIVIEGTLSGSVSAVTTYTITAQVGTEGAGSVDPSEAVVDEGDDTSLEATPSTGYKFLNWTKGSDSEWSSTDNPLVINDVNANETYTANFKKLLTVNYDVTGVLPSLNWFNPYSTEYYDEGESFTIPYNRFISYAGKTFAYWTDGEVNYLPGASVTMSKDLILTPVLIDETRVLGDQAFTLYWPFGQADGAPVLNCEGKNSYYVRQPLLNVINTSETIDVVMLILTRGDFHACTPAQGKFNNLSSPNCAQVNKYTTFDLLAVKGMEIKLTATQKGNASTSSVKLYENSAGEGRDADSCEDGVLTFVYNGDARQISLVDQGDNLYPSGITVTYPKAYFTKQISAAGYATLYSEKPLDFSETEVKAYIAKSTTGGNVLFEPIEKIPAYTGVLLKGAANTYEIPYAITPDAVASNLFEGVLYDTTVDAESAFLLMNGDQGVGFYKNTYEFTVGANTAYLPASVAEGRAFIGFADESETTGINEVKTMKASNDIYNLKGQRVEKAKKGLYIIGGKKVVMK